jgi:prevent-host-death family protein
MAELGVRELKKRASEIIRAVKEKRDRYVITLRGRPVAVILPIDEAPATSGKPEAWDELTRLGEQIAQNWTAEQSASEILSQMRR